MNFHEQLAYLRDTGEYPHFSERVKETLDSSLRADHVEILQINMGKRCNLSCKHCHVFASPDQTELMSREVLERCLEASGFPEISTIDITGGSPEMNPWLEWFLSRASMLGKRLIVRSNCAILLEEEYSKFFDIYARYRVEIITSLPDCRGIATDTIRGRGTFQKIIQAMKMLNERGYGKRGSGLILSLVHNPAGAFLPGPQQALESEYARMLSEYFDIRFNGLYCITNIPIGRYLEFLIRSGNYDDYIRELCSAYNPDAVRRVMCKTTISVGWDGTLYDCDFNQMLDIPVNHSAPQSVFDFDPERLAEREIMVHNHCYGCTAGSGSSCQGATVQTV